MTFLHIQNVESDLQILKTYTINLVTIKWINQTKISLGIWRIDFVLLILYKTVQDTWMLEWSSCLIASLQSYWDLFILSVCMSWPPTHILWKHPLLSKNNFFINDFSKPLALWQKSATTEWICKCQADEGACAPCINLLWTFCAQNMNIPAKKISWDSSWLQKMKGLSEKL